MRIFWKILIVVLFLPLFSWAQAIPEEFMVDLTPTQKSEVRRLRALIQDSKNDEALKTIQENLTQGKAYAASQQSFLLFNLVLQDQAAWSKKDKTLQSRTLEQFKSWSGKTVTANTKALQYATRNIADRYFENKDPVQAQELLNLLIKDKNVPLLVREQAMFQMAFHLRDPDNPGPSLRYVDQILASPRKEEDNFAGQALVVRAYHSFFRNPSQTEKDLLEALKILQKQKIPYNSDIANVHQQLAEIYFVTAEYAKVLQHVNQAEVFIKKNPVLSEVDRRNLLYARALQSFVLQDLPAAENDLHRVIPMAESKDSKWEYQSRLFTVIRLQGKVEESRAIYASLQKSSEEEAPPKVRCIAAGEFSSIEIGLGNPPRAVEMLKETQKYISSKTFRGKEGCKAILEAQLAFAESFLPHKGDELLNRFPPLEQTFKKLYGDIATGPRHLLYTLWFSTLLVEGRYQEALNKIYQTQKLIKTSLGYSPMHFYIHLQEAIAKGMMGQQADAQKKVKDIQSYLNLPISKQARSLQQPLLDLVKAYVEDGKKNPEKVRKLLTQDKTHTFRFYVLRGKL